MTNVRLEYTAATGQAISIHAVIVNENEPIGEQKIATFEMADDETLAEFRERTQTAFNDYVTYESAGITAPVAVNTVEKVKDADGNWFTRTVKKLETEI